MDTNTSKEELLTKTRKPYTITKQRERWTEDEHDRFLEALRLYGRAWQQIEEHIGTKTAVQIRSHAQKFFTKLEKEAEAKGVPVSKALDIDIPPPRPKRKPNTPYPRKNGASSSQVSSAKDAKLISSASSSHINRTLLDLKKMPSSQNTFVVSEPSLGKESANNETRKTSNVDKTVQDVPKKNKDRDGNDITMHNMQNYPQNHPSGMVSQDFMFRPMGEEEIHKHTNHQATTSHQAYPACHSQDYNSFLQISSTFSNLIMSTLLQNPAAHAAATFAASAWPYTNLASSVDSSTQSSSSPPSLAAIAAATVAAATAWWASHGLLPVCAPTPVTCVPLTTVAVPTPMMNKMDTDQLPLQKQNTALQDQNIASKSPALSSDDSEATGITKLNDGLKTNGDKAEEVVVAASVHDSQKKRMVDRSSCGSNTPSGSDAETDALDKMEKDKEDLKEIDANHSSIAELSNRRSKTRDNNNPITDSWKEVSEEGRIAFQALFARERLPQSFSPPQMAENMNGKQSEATNLKIQDSCDADQESVVMASVGSSKSFQTRQTGFKPYKRCSMEVKESQVGNTNNQIQSDENVCKRLRLEGEAST